MYLAALFLLFKPTLSLIGYDCGGQHLNITTVSLLDSGDCHVNIQDTNTTQVYIQLLQLSDYNYAEVIQCKAEITRSIFHCGMHSHISTVHHSQASYLEDIISDECDRMHKDGLWRLGVNSEIISGLRVNTTVTKSITLAGTIKGNGECKGINYNDAYGSWQDVIVQGIAKITLKSGYSPIRLQTGKIYLKSGTICELKDGHCLDSEDGYSFWKPMPTSSCDFHQYDVLYEGVANKTRDETFSQPAPLIYSLETQDITFALTATTQLSICGYILLKTEHPRLFLLETTSNNVPKQKGDIPVDNLDIFTYVNSKFVYVEKHIRTQMTSLYHNVIEHRCKLEKEIITNSLSLAALLPDEFAYRLMKGPGYMAVTAGEAIHIIKCIPIETVIRKTEECYIELPVTVRNTSYFLTPKSRILTKYGIKRECSRELPTLYRIEDTWVEFSPEPHVQHLPPQQIQPLTTITWKYLTPGPLATSGIYSKSDIDKLRDHIMFPAEKPAVLNSLAMGIAGYKTGGHIASMYDFLDEDSLNKIAESTAKRIWSGFVTFGSATAGVLGIFIIIRLVKIIIDTAIHGYALHSVYGCSLHLLGALWSSLTHLLLHLAHRPPSRHNQHSNTNNGKNNGPAAEQPLIIVPDAPTDITIEQPQGESTPKDIHKTTSNLTHTLPRSETCSNLTFTKATTHADYVNMKPLNYVALSKRLDALE